MVDNITFDTATMVKIEELAYKLAQLYRQQLDEKGINASGELSRFETTVDIWYDHLFITFDLNDYWKWVENGRPRGKQPPLQDIERWIEVKKLVPNPRDNKVPNAKQLVYLIARKIGRDGYYSKDGSPFEGKHPLQDAKDSAQWQTIISDIKGVITRSIKKKINAALKDAISN